MPDTSSADTASVDTDPSALSHIRRLRFLVKDTLLYGLSGSVARLFGLLSFPLLSRSLSVEDFGTFDLLTTYVALTVTMATFGQDSAAVRLLADTQKSDQRKTIVTTSLVWVAGFVAAILVVGLVFGLRERGWLAIWGISKPLYWLSLAQVPFLLVAGQAQNLMKWTFARTRYLVLTLGSSAATTAAIALAVALWPRRLIEVVAALLVVRAIVGVAAVSELRQWWRLVAWNRQYSRDLWAYGWPLGIVCVLAAIAPAYERVLVTKVLGPHELGLYAAGIRVALLIALPIQAFQIAWGPFSLALRTSPSAIITYNWTLKLLAATMFTCAILLAALSDPILELLAGDRYKGASSVVFWLAMGLAIQAIGWVTEIGISFGKKTTYGIAGYLSYIAIGLPLSLMLSKTMGINGVAIGVLCGHVTKTSVSFVYAQRAYRMAWHYRSVLLLTAVTIAVGAVSQVIGTPSRVSAVAVAVAGVTTVWSITYFVALNASDRHQLRSFTQRLRRRASVL